MGKIQTTSGDRVSQCKVFDSYVSESVEPDVLEEGSLLAGRWFKSKHMTTRAHSLSGNHRIQAVVGTNVEYNHFRLQIARDKVTLNVLEIMFQNWLADDVIA